ncbi:hypothetical protein FH972_003957 [Carpinus fangiana]|uniref:Proliferating cell nuclear antigen PCNA N-terminal domain-containing protein n=1 Tax=Carpinus fangiana TaxID=176857 RepID=A0A5N6QN12_9ROSI|nr:hypothetical protein FH972_003957 [Carpinus fangiana]
MLEITLKQGLILRKALAPLTEIAEEATFKYSSEGIELIALNTDSILMGVLKFRSIDFQHFVCDTEGIGCVDLNLLYETLFFVDNEEYCSVTINHGLCEIGGPGLHFMFKNCRTLEERYGGIELTERDPEQILPDESETEYDLVAAIPSEEFRCILKHLFFFGHQVFVAITDKQVKFSALNAEIVLKKELSECIIGGSAGDLPVQLSFEMEHIRPLMNASLLSNMVWILHSNDSISLQLNFPVGALGNIMLYFT